MDNLILLQNDIFGRIARSYENMMKTGAANITVGLLEARMLTLEGYWMKFQNQHDRLVIDYGAELSRTDYIKRDLQQEAEEAYHTQKARYLDALRDMRSLAQPEAHAAAPENATPAHSKLPRIVIPQFSGRYEDWPAFRDLFVSLVVDHPTASPVQKLHHLKTSLKGEAEQVTRSLSTTDANFERTWRALIDHYENRRLLARAYTSRLLSLTKMKSESASELRKLCVNSTVGALEGIERPLTKSDDLCLQLISELLDQVSRREWETQLGGTTEPPSLNELMLFIGQRMRTLEILQPVKGESGAKSAAGSSRQTRSLHARGQEGSRGRCFLCSKEHYLRRCETYLSKSAAERKTYVEANGLCTNCLGKHQLSACPSTGVCTSCKARHHSTLHDVYVSAAVVTAHSAQPRKTPLSTVLLATARVRVADRFGDFHVARALIDQGSESSLISESLAQRLRLPRSRASIAGFGVGGAVMGDGKIFLAHAHSSRSRAASVMYPLVVL